MAKKKSKSSQRTNQKKRKKKREHFASSIKRKRTSHSAEQSVSEVIELEYASELDEMLNPSYQMSTLMCTLFISFFQDHRADIIDVFTHQITGLLNFEDVELSDSTIFYTQKPYLYIPLCHSGHWILLKFETNTGLLKIFNSVSQYESTVAVNVIVNCLRSSYNRIVQIQRLPCPQQQNGTDCGFYTQSHFNFRESVMIVLSFKLKSLKKPENFHFDAKLKEVRECNRMKILFRKIRGFNLRLECTAE